MVLWVYLNLIYAFPEFADVWGEMLRVYVYRCVCIHECMGLRDYRFADVWSYGVMDSWVDLRTYGSMGSWIHGFLVFRNYEVMGVCIR